MFFAWLSRVVRGLIWGAIALLGTFVLLVVGLVFLPVTGDLPDPDAEALRGIRSVWMYAESDESAESCGIDHGGITAAAKAALGRSSFRIIEPPAEHEATLVYRVEGVSVADRCVLMVQWNLHAGVLTRKDRRNASATVAFDTALVEFPRQDLSRGKSAVFSYVERDMRELTRRWAKVNGLSPQVNEKK